MPTIEDPNEFIGFLDTNPLKLPKTLSQDVCNLLASAPDPGQFDGCEPLEDLKGLDECDFCYCQGCGKPYLNDNIMIVDCLGPVCLNCNYWMAYICLAGSGK